LFLVISLFSIPNHNNKATQKPLKSSFFSSSFIISNVIYSNQFALIQVLLGKLNL
jgi:hypothetical protein